MLYSNLIVVIVSISTISSTNGIPKTSLTNQHLLDRRGNLVLGWSITSDRKSIEIELLANCTGYVGISFSKGRLYEPDAMADIILAGYDDASEAGYIEVIPLFMFLKKGKKNTIDSVNCRIDGSICPSPNTFPVVVWTVTKMLSYSWPAIADLGP